MPVRQIPKSYRSITGQVASFKNGRPVAFESSLERDLLLWLEFDSRVSRYEEQPVKLEYFATTGKCYTYTPDLLITYQLEGAASTPFCPLLVEVKYRSDLFQDWPRLKPKFKAARALAKAQGWHFTIFTEKEIRTPAFANVRFLLSYQRYPVAVSDVTLLLNHLDLIAHPTPEKLLATCTADCEQKAALLSVLWHLVATGQVGLDLNAPLNMQSLLWLPTSPCSFTNFYGRGLWYTKE